MIEHLFEYYSGSSLACKIGPPYRRRVTVTSGEATPSSNYLGYTTTPGRSRNMAAIRRTDTKPEVALRSALHSAGYRFRKDYPLRLAGRLVRPDIAFTRAKVAVFVDGCFWHCCPLHGRQPTSNTGYWSPKLQGNVDRDRLQTELLEANGWRVVRVWSHESTEYALHHVAKVVGQQAGSPAK